ncbi:recombinase family protein [Peteryoungia algae]|uniref:Recombinase family protein n=1 Tax=Peteryoungia algae TaxID=2919917 RepID=A0ABT0D5G1_9HYPH|nr:recombinase family protein [Rhizobium sp. SSM4.3]MCJ8240630.1 recombinase family protein [Rhizobium sp. SSM4.3]
MTAKNAKTAIIYARYSTDRQTDVSIETQVELCQNFIADRGWQLLDTYSDRAISGSNYLTRPGIQRVLNRIKSSKVDVVLCVTVDRVSRDAEHGNGFLKRLRYNSTELWTVHGGSSVTDIEMGLRATLSQELVEQIRYRTREGMKTAVRRGKATTCLAYGYRIKLEYDAHGERIPGLREVDPVQAEVVQEIFSLYADGVSPSAIAVELNRRGIPGPRAAAWRDTAIRGHVDRGTGILNNELYLGRAIWNRREYRKNPDTERRIARHNDSHDWVVDERPELRIIPDDLWSAVKRRQLGVRGEFERTLSNPLNRTHRPSYLLSGLLECAECGGPYAVMATGRYGCTNHKKKIPLDVLGGACCSNHKTILRRELEDRILTSIPAALVHMDVFRRTVDKVLQSELAEQKTAAHQTQDIAAALERNRREQEGIVAQMSQRAAEGRRPNAALDDRLDRLDDEREALERQLASAPSMDKPVSDAERLAALRDEINEDTVRTVIHAMLYMMRDHADPQTKQPLIGIIRQLIQKVVIASTPGRQPPALEVHGRIASILAAMETAQVMEARFKAMVDQDVLARQLSGALDTEDKKQKLLAGYAEELSRKRLEWQQIQVSVVAGAGFEPAAFRL